MMERGGGRGDSVRSGGGDNTPSRGGMKYSSAHPPLSVSHASLVPGPGPFPSSLPSLSTSP